jgi:hypothetical protein
VLTVEASVLEFYDFYGISSPCHPTKACS